MNDKTMYFFGCIAGAALGAIAGIGIVIWEILLLKKRNKP